MPYPATLRGQLLGVLSLHPHSQEYPGSGCSHTIVAAGIATASETMAASWATHTAGHLWQMAHRVNGTSMTATAAKENDPSQTLDAKDMQHRCM